MTFALLGGALLAGLVGAPHCLGMCGGLATAACDRPSSSALYHIGRLGTYAALGALAGGAGRALPGPAWVPLVVAGVFLAVFAAKLAGWSPRLPAPARDLLGRASALSAVGARALRRPGPWGRLLFGAVNGLLPCGLVWAALSMPVASGSAGAGALTMIAFGLGTVPVLAAATVGLRRATARSPRGRLALGLTVFALGLGALAWRAPSLSAPSDVPACHTQP